MMTNWFPSVLWRCWFGHLACKNRARNDLLCVESDVKPLHYYTTTVEAVSVFIILASTSKQRYVHCSLEAFWAYAPGLCIDFVMTLGTLVGETQKYCGICENKGCKHGLCVGCGVCLHNECSTAVPKQCVPSPPSSFPSTHSSPVVSYLQSCQL